MPVTFLGLPLPSPGSAGTPGGAGTSTVSQRTPLAFTGFDPELFLALGILLFGGGLMLVRAAPQRSRIQPALAPAGCSAVQARPYQGSVVATQSAPRPLAPVTTRPKVLEPDAFVPEPSQRPAPDTIPTSSRVRRPAGAPRPTITVVVPAAALRQHVSLPLSGSTRVRATVRRA